MTTTWLVSPMTTNILGDPGSSTQPCGIQSLDLNASGKFSVLDVHDFDRAFHTFLF